MIEREKTRDILGEQKGNDISIDTHTHCGIDHYNFIRGRYPTSQSVKDLAMKLKLAGVEYAVTFPCASSPYYFDLGHLTQKGPVLVPQPVEDYPYQFANRQLQYEVQLFGDNRILPFAAILPKFKEDEQVEYLEHLTKQGSLFGLKYHSLTSKTDVRDLADSQFINFADAHSIPLLIHSGTNSNARPESIISMARQFPTVRFCVAHVGLFEQSAFDMLEDTDTNVFFDTSPFLSLCTLTSIDMERGKGGQKLDLPYDNPRNALVKLHSSIPTRLVWGTDEPWTTITDDTQQTILAKFDYSDEVKLLKSLPDDTRIKIANDNTQQFLFGE